ncbi:MAG: lytic murein transglycosylase B [Acidiferrobacterales bacterium]
MIRHLISTALLTTVLSGFVPTVLAIDVSQYPQMQSLLKQLQRKHDFDYDKLVLLFHQVEIKQDILDIMNRPGEARPWHLYRQQFVTVPSANRGSQFWQLHQHALARAQKKFGVDPAIIVAIIGVETRYGRSAGRIRTIDALTTLALEYPRRAKFFRRELIQFMLLAREQQLDPLSIKGSYAGAMGAAQFIPSSYRRYAIDFDGDGRADLMDSRADAIGSVANYFKHHGWKTGEPAITRAAVTGTVYTWFRNLRITPVLTLKQLSHYGITPVRSDRDPNLRATLITLEGEHGTEYRLGHDNYYVITRYNKNRKYAVAVYELSEMIRQRFKESGS